MEWRGKVCVAHLWGRGWLLPVCPSVALAYPSSGGRSDEVLGGGAVVGCLPFQWGGRPVFRAPSLGCQDFGPSYEMLDRITWDLNKAWRE